MAKRDKYLRKFNCTKSLDMEYLYKKFRNNVVSETGKSKNDYYSQYFARHKSNMKMLWSGIRSIINVKSNVGISISSLYQNGANVEEPKKMADIFNNVFVNTAHKINEKIPHTRKSQSDYLSSKNSNSFFVSPVSPAEIKIIINSMTSGKAVGPCSFPIFLLKKLSELIATPLCDIINDAFSNGIFPLYKKNLAEDPSNYRPISLLSVFSKITEKLMYTGLYNFLEQHNVLYSLHFGFRSKNSTLHA